MKFVRTARYERSSKRLLADDEKQAMERAIADDPEAHPVIPGTGGIRKARWAAKGKGKSGGVRTIYFYFVSDAEIHLLFMYAKNAQSDLTFEQRKTLATHIKEAKHAKKEARQDKAKPGV